MTNDERARQIHAKHHPDSCGYQYMQKSCSFCDELAAALAEARLEEAQWWHDLIVADGGVTHDCAISGWAECERLAELKQQSLARSVSSKEKT